MQELGNWTLLSPQYGNSKPGDCFRVWVSCRLINSTYITNCSFYNDGVALFKKPSNNGEYVNYSSNHSVDWYQHCTASGVIL